MMENLLLSTGSLEAEDPGLVIFGITPSTVERRFELGLAHGSLTWRTDLPDSKPFPLEVTTPSVTSRLIFIPPNATKLIFENFVRKGSSPYFGVMYNTTNSIIESVIEWDTFPWHRLGFINSVALKTLPSTLFKTCTALTNFVQGCSVIDTDVSQWDVSNVTDFSYAFANTKLINPDITNWNISPTANILGMVRSAEAFNRPLHNLDVSQQTSLREFFYSCSKFNQPLHMWDISNVKNISSMFGHASSFDQDLSNWVFQAGTNKANYDNGASKWQAAHKPKFL